MFFWVLPNIADHRDTVANLMSRALGQRVTLEAVSGYATARPEFRLQACAVTTEGQPSLYLPETEAAFAWRSLLFLSRASIASNLQGLTLVVRRAHDGHFTSRHSINPADRDSDFSWLLRQGGACGQATLTCWTRCATRALISPRSISP